MNNIALFSWIERIGANRTVFAYSVAQLAGLGVTGLSRGYGSTLVGSALIGLSMGGISIATNVLVTEGAAPDVRRRWLSGLHAMYGASALCGPVWVTLCYQYGWGWRWTIASLGVGSLAVAARAVVTHRARADQRTVAAVEPDVAVSPKVPNRPLSAGAYYGMLCMCYVAAEVTISSRLPLYARREGYSAAGANALLATFYFGLFAGRLALALVGTPWKSMAILVGSATSGLVCCVLGLGHDPVWLAVAGFCFSVFYPAAMALISDEHGADGGMLYVTSWCVTLQALGLMAMHIGVGYASDALGLGRALWIGPMALAATLLLLAMGRPAAS